MNTGGDETHSATKTKKHKNTVTVLSEIAPSATTSSTLNLPAQSNLHTGRLSSTSEHVLVAFGTIGAFIILLAVVYFTARWKKIDLLSRARGRQISKGGPRGWYGWREREMDYATDGPPPKYPGYDEEFDLPSEQKRVPAQRQLNAKYSSPTIVPKLATPESAATLLRGIDTQRQEAVREALLSNPAPFGVSLAQSTEQPVGEPFYSQPSYDPISTHNQTYNSNAASAGHSRRNSESNEPTQREIKYMSYLSSLSSGFGDQIIIPEPVSTKPTNIRASRQSYRQSRKFSWAGSAEGLHGDRDTVYTTTSTDSTPPRFQTINSWVAQQTGRVERQQQANDEVPAMPGIPRPLQTGVSVDHQRKPSEDPAFRHHPGDEIELSRGVRIPSTILDKNFGIS
ncbi:hypothetical protein D0Z07_4839 [Hyphodiscus hymeniophilus]|uniref:Uncharacterized protein n=1 Tax=Hyphodiscus hymeniophilus TaxID=353542 RepID=A0A9P6VJ60_9HELO|nr:hypothetical protein D0Z07_4839 [Hyphodiscus hymeniophilus]